MWNMVITGLEARAYAKPYERPISNGLYTYVNTEIVTVELFTDEGISGIGWTHGNNIVLETIRALRLLVVGENPFRVERIWNKMYLPKVFGRKGLTTRAISAVDIALWDLMGKATGHSVSELLGGFREEVPAYMAGGYYVDTTDDEGALRDEVQAKLDRGARAIKMKVGRLGIREDIRRVELVRSVIGDDVDLLVDANNAYRLADAQRMARELERLGCYWFEEPLHPDALRGASELARSVDIPIAAGENEYTRWGFRDLIHAGAADIINPDAQVLGGITEWRKVAAYASAHHIPVAPHGDQEIHVHLVAAVDNGLIVEYYDKGLNTLQDLLIHSDLVFVNGNVRPPSGPGLGVELDYEAAEPYRVG